jgi:hypothetical protein
MNPGDDSMSSRSRLRRSVAASVCALLSCAFADSASALQGGADSASAQQGDNVRYVRAGPQGAKARNLYDKSGLVVLDLQPGALMAVHSERGDWLSVEVPGGFKVWVFGQYVKAGTQAGMLEITASEVRQRPIPSSGDQAFPIAPNLTRGERVHLIGRADKSLPLDQDWVQVWSPPGVRAWVARSQTEALPADVGGAAAWANAIVAIQNTRTRSVPTPQPADKPPVAGAVPAAAPTGAAKDGAGGEVSRETRLQALELLGEADDMLARARGMDAPNYDAVRAAFTRALEASGNDGPTAEILRSRLKEVEAYAEAATIKAELEEARAQREEGQLKRRQAIEQAAKETDLYAGRFDARGWLERRDRPGQPGRFVLVWSGNDVAEVVCKTGRYDLPMFENYELGIVGFPTGARQKTIDVSRLEVLSGRFRGR